MKSRSARRRPLDAGAGPTFARRSARGAGLLLLALAVAGLGWYLLDREREPAGAMLPEAGALADCSLLLVTLDTTRADRLGCYGHAGIETPTLDRLAREGVLFSAATAVAPTTLASHASILTGLYPARHGVRTNGFFRLEDGHETLAERLRSEGWRTGAIVSAFVLDAQFGLSQGFEHYDDDLTGAGPAPDRHYRSRRADRTTDRALSWLRDSAPLADRFFLWVHYFDPHHDYDPPSPFAERYAGHLYDGEIAFVDSELKRLIDALDELDLSERCLVVVAGDHGEGLGQHDESTHSYLTYESTLRIPLLMRCGSRLGGGKDCTRPVSQVDIMPSVLSLLGLDPGPADGVAMTANPVADRPLFFESLAGTLECGWEPLVGVTSGSYKYIHSSAPELYDLARDPHEKRNILSANRSRATELKDQLSGLFGPDLDRANQVTPTVRPSADALESLQALGYLAGGPSHQTGSKVAGRPQEMIRLLNQVDRARSAALPLEQNVAHLRAVLREHPDFYPAWMALGSVYLRNDDTERAAEALSQCVRLKPGAPQAVFGLAGLQASRQRPEEALSLLEPLLEEYPDYLRARYLSALVLSSLGRWPESADHFKLVFEADPEYEDCLTRMRTALEQSNRTEELASILREQLERNPGAVEIRLALAQEFSRQEQDRAAESLLRDGLELDPGDPRTVHRLALLKSSSADPSVRNRAAAAALLEPFAKKGAGKPSLMYTLCALYAGSGRMEAALTIGMRARALALKNGNTKLASALDRQLNDVVRPALEAPPKK